jgi:predicted MFS family arabinose efflux permease
VRHPLENTIYRSFAVSEILPPAELVSPQPGLAWHGGLPFAFFVVAFAVGGALDTVLVSMPLLAIASGLSSAVLGLLYACSTLGIAFAAAGATLVLERIGPRNLLVCSLAVLGPGEIVLGLPVGTVALVVGVTVVGAAIGLFWTASMSLLSSSAGSRGSERAFVWQYVFYIGGSAAGGISAGLVTAAASAAGASHLLSLRLSFGVGVVAAIVAAVLWRPGRTRAAPGVRPRLADLPRLGVVLQLPAILMIAAMGLVYPLAPLVLGGSDGWSAVELGFVLASTAIARMFGSLLGGRLVGLLGSTRATTAMLAVSCGATALAIALYDRPFVFIALLLAIFLTGIGAWPIALAAALARTDPVSRSTMSAAWNLREYVTIAIASLSSGVLFGRSGAAVPLAVATGLLVLAALAAALVFSRNAVHAAAAA